MMKKALILLGLASVFLLCGAPSYNTITPSCSTPGPASACLFPGQSGFLFNAEQPTSTTRSQQFQIPYVAAQPVANLSVECIWASNPGTFEYDIQRADTDATGNYVTIQTAGAMTSAPQANGSGNYVATVDLSPWRGTYISLYVKTQTANAVNGTCKLTR